MTIMIIFRKFLVLGLLSLLMVSIYVDEYFVGAQNNNLDAASNVVNQAFKILLSAENTGANVTSLVNQLNRATVLLSEAENAYRIGDTATVNSKSDEAVSIARQVNVLAQQAKEEAQNSTKASFWSNLAITITGLLTLIIVLFTVWRFFRRNYLKNLNNSKSEGANDEA